MKTYADTNFFTNLLMSLPQSVAADGLANSLRKQTTAPLPVTNLLRMELVNALQRLVYESQHGSQLIPATRQRSLMAEVRFEMEMESGPTPLWQPTPVDEQMLFNLFHTLAHRHTAKQGFRTYDILHVATALLLGCDTFWSFDAKARKLAKLEGLATN